MHQDEIRIENLEVYAYHGVYPEENEKGQHFFVNMTLYTELRSAGISDELSLSTDYGQVCRFIDHWMKEHTCRLIEAAAENLAREVLLAFPLVHELEVEIRKPEAPIGLPFESVSVKLRRGWHKAYIAIGSNMGDREEYIRLGIRELKKSKDIRAIRTSRLIETKAYGGVEQGDFINGVLELETLAAPGELLDFLHAIENMAGRQRTVHWGPRTLDLDIVFYDRLVYEDEHLVIPHVDMQNRDFVLQPMAELNPNMRHPVLGKTMQELLNELR